MPDEYTRLMAGDKIPEFRVKTIDGQELNVGPDMGRMVLLHFFILSCPYCRNSLERLELLQEKLKDAPGFFMISIGREHSAEELKNHKDSNKLEICLAPDTDRSIYNRFAERKVPRCYLFSKNGTLLFQVRGSDEQAFHELLQIVHRELASG